MNAVEVRNEILSFLERELVGPDPRPEHAEFHTDEILRPQDPPRMRFSAGVLFPDRTRAEDKDILTPDEGKVVSEESGPPEGEVPEEAVEPEAEMPLEEALDHAANEHEVNRANEFLPSAMGLTALVRLPRKLKVKMWAARYEKRSVPGLGRQDEQCKWQPHWFRRAVDHVLEFDCATLAASERKVLRGADGLWVKTDHETSKLELHVFSRRHSQAADPARDRLVTFTLINQTPSGSGTRDEVCFFQCGFSVEASDGSACFLKYPERETLAQCGAGVAESKEAKKQREEEESLALLYRHRQTFAVGHGCAARWSDAEGESVWRVETDVMPRFELFPVVARGVTGLNLSMKRLAEAPMTEQADLCAMLANAYAEWIDAKSTEVAGAFPPTHRAAAERHLELCRECLRRIRDGIALLGNDEKVRLAFSWMNHSMLEQQLHYELASKRRREWRVEKGQLVIGNPYQTLDLANPPEGKGKWRPFQLAFILMNLRAISRRDSAEREVADLIWFPTGGGKTEAYLGLTAFAILWRRLANPLHGGVTVLMRYTLRLLTTQQYQRAASLICSLDRLRTKNERQLGRQSISIGLWVGGTVTPNKDTEAVAALRKLQQHGKPNPFVVLACPWCGAAMGPVKVHNAYQTPGYKSVGSKVVFRCHDSACDFNRVDLPLLVVDEAIYEDRPTLLIGTVDKFALLPWVPQTRNLFGGGPLDLPPPDLIIQDELHLIAGALGSMVGHYEMTLDALTRHGLERRPAKIVASTATICRADDQIWKLYGRGAFLFPPQGLQAGDSFFAAEDTSKPGRLYVGAFGAALGSHVTAQVRVLAALLQAALSVPGATRETIDPYWTLMGYFNSLRELGHAATLIRADIREHLNAVWHRLGIKRPAQGEPELRRFINCDLELTSRIRSDEITEVLARLFEEYRTGLDAEGHRLNRAVDLCLATNMIQVGLDVPRLGLMAVVGQPKTSSEYIQATSRVGRSEGGPGLVVTIFNAAKPRDRSHYEHFRSYHQSIYRWVEPTSVTPFAIPVRERALHAQVVALARHLGGDQIRREPRPSPDEDLVARIRNLLLERVALVDPDEKPGMADYFEEWLAKWRNCEPARYGRPGERPPDDPPLMYPLGSEPRAQWGDVGTKTPTSMRNVDASCEAIVVQQLPEPA